MGGRSESKGGIRRSVAFCCSEMLRKCADKWKQDCVQAYFGRALVAASDSSLRRLLHSVCVASTLCVVVVVVVADACAPPGRTPTPNSRASRRAARSHAGGVDHELHAALYRQEVE